MPLCRRTPIPDGAGRASCGVLLLPLPPAWGRPPQLFTGSPKSTGRFLPTRVREDPSAAFPAPGTGPAFKLLSDGSFHPERTELLSPRITGILLKLFCQHPDQARFIFNDILMLLLHSCKDCFDTSRIFDSLVKIKYWKLNKNYP